MKMTKENMELFNEVQEVGTFEETNTNTLEESDMETTEVYLVKEEGFLVRNKKAVGAAAGTGVAGFVGGFITGTLLEKKKNKALMNAIKEEIAHFVNVRDGVAEGIIEETYAFRNANDIKFKILDKINNQKLNAKDKAEWLDTLDMIMEIAVIGREKQIVTEREIITE